MTSSLDMTICRRCGEPMAAVVSGGALPRYLCRLCGDLGFAAVLPSVGPAPAGDVTQFITGTIEQVGLNLDVVVCRSTIQPGGEPLHNPPPGRPDQLPLHRTQLLQRHCA
ncbi:hypothetical protein FHT98_0660 [Bosea sp. AK1]|nr:hypothetical protein FHT98_0660 [Bosea sp. AK1]